MPLFLCHKNLTNPTGQRLTPHTLSKLALGFAGDDGETEQGTREAMAWVAKVEAIAEGEELFLERGFFIVRRKS